MKKIGYEKFIQYGDFVEVYQYESEPVVRFRKKNKRNIYLKRRRNYSSARAKRQFYRIVASNLDPKSCILGTFTMRDVVSLNIAYKYFRNFINRWKGRGDKFEYVAVPEFQQRGAVHFHVLFFNLPYDFVRTERQSRYIANLWGHGFVDLVATDGSTKLATYLSKYMTKAGTDTRLAGLKAYTSSRGLKRPVVMTTYKYPKLYSDAKKMTGVDNDIDPIVNKDYDTKWLGKGNYKLFNLK